MNPDENPKTENQEEEKEVDESQEKKQSKEPSVKDEEMGGGSLNLGAGEGDSSSEAKRKGEGKDEDLIGVQANEPLTFIIENAHSDMQVVIDDDKNGDIEIDDGSFTLPAEFVSNDFKIRAENDAVETNELFISVEK